MSCHDIGRGVDFIIEKVLDMYDHGKISKEATWEMLNTFPNAVNYCDGNIDEALDTMTYTHCSGCLKKYSEEENAVLFNDVDTMLKYDTDVIDNKNERYCWTCYWWEGIIKKYKLINGYSFCLDCFTKYFFETLTDCGKEKILKKYAQK